MPDWNRVIRERLGNLELPSALQEEVIVELAAHFEDTYRHWLDTGVNESKAFEYAVSMQSDWYLLARNIERAKSKEQIMNRRTQTLWIPGLVSLFGYLVWLIFLQVTDSWLRLSLKHPAMSWLPYAVWLTSLPFIAAGSAYLSQGAGGSRRVRITASVFPSIAMSVVWVIVLFVMVVWRRPFENIAFSYGFLHAVVFPGFALLLGTIPFLKRRKVQNSSLPS